MSAPRSLSGLDVPAAVLVELRASELRDRRREHARLASELRAAGEVQHLQRAEVADRLGQGGELLAALHWSGPASAARRGHWAVQVTVADQGRLGQGGELRAAVAAVEAQRLQRAEVADRLGQGGGELLKPNFNQKSKSTPKNRKKNHVPEKVTFVTQ